jgi:hypothetical protein
MAVVIPPINVASHTFLNWVQTTNAIVDVLGTTVVTTGGIAAVGDAVITGGLQADTLYADTIAGGAIGSPGTLTFSTNTTLQGITTVQGNIEFTAANTFLGNYANIALIGSNTTHNTVGVNPISQRLEMRNVPVFAVSATPTQNSVLYWDGTSYKDTNVITINTTSKTVTFANTIELTGNIRANTSFGTAGAMLLTDGNLVYWSNTSNATIGANGFVSTGISNFNSGLLYVNPLTSRIGVNTTTPAYTLDVIGTINANTILSNGSPVWTAANDGHGSTLDADTLDTFHATDFIMRNTASNTTSIVTFTGGIVTNNVETTSTTTNFLVSANAVGIGQNTPIYKLDVAGTFRATGNAHFTSNAYFGLPSVTNQVGLIDLLKSTGSTLAGNTTISTNGQQIQFFENGGTRRGAYIDFTKTSASVGSELWHSGAATFSSTANGYLRLPNGLLMQWGNRGSSINGNTTAVITFPIPFTTACYNVQVTSVDDDRNDLSIFTAPNTTTFTVRNNSGSAINNFYWFAVGV